MCYERYQKRACGQEIFVELTSCKQKKKSGTCDKDKRGRFVFADKAKRPRPDCGGPPLSPRSPRLSEGGKMLTESAKMEKQAKAQAAAFREVNVANAQLRQLIGGKALPKWMTEGDAKVATEREEAAVQAFHSPFAAKATKGPRKRKVVVKEPPIPKNLSFTSEMKSPKETSTRDRPLEIVQAKEDIGPDGRQVVKFTNAGKGAKRKLDTDKSKSVPEKKLKTAPIKNAQNRVSFPKPHQGVLDDSSLKYLTPESPKNGIDNDAANELVIDDADAISGRTAQHLARRFGSSTPTPAPSSSSAPVPTKPTTATETKPKRKYTKRAPPAPLNLINSSSLFSTTTTISKPSTHYLRRPRPTHSLHTNPPTTLLTPKSYLLKRSLLRISLLEDALRGLGSEPSLIHSGCFSPGQIQILAGILRTPRTATVSGKSESRASKRRSPRLAEKTVVADADAFLSNLDYVQLDEGEADAFEAALLSAASGGSGGGLKSGGGAGDEVGIGRSGFVRGKAVDLFSSDESEEE